MRMILAIFDLQITLMLSPKFPSLSTGLWVQEKKRKIDFQDSGHCSHLGFLNGPILAIFSSTSHPDASYQVSTQLVLVQEKKRQIDFQDGGHLGFAI